MNRLLRLAVAMTLCASAVPAAAQAIFTGSGPTTTTASDSFRTALGGGTIAGANGSFVDSTGARREINWDGVPDTLAAPNNLPANFFNVNSPRGVVLSTPGSGFQVSATAASGTPIEFGNIDASYTQIFATFSPQRLFTALGSNIVDINFFLPGTTTPAFVSGFGSIFTDVDLAGSTSISFFGPGNVLLGTWNVPNVAGNETLSFLGVLFGEPLISRVRITSGNAALQPGGLDSITADRVAMDDFLFSEPTLRAVPEPGSWLMMLLGFGALGWQLRRRRKSSPARSVA